MKFGTWLVGMVQPLLAKILVSLGFSVVTLTGVSVAVDGLKQAIVNNVQAMPTAMLQLFLLAGGGTAIGIIFGAFTFAVTMHTLRSATKILSKPTA